MAGSSEMVSEPQALIPMCSVSFHSEITRGWASLHGYLADVSNLWPTVHMHPRIDMNVSYCVVKSLDTLAGVSD